MEKITRKVVMDTNFLLLPYQFGVDIFKQVHELVENAEVVIPDAVLEELDGLSKNMGKTGRAANLALKILGKEKWEKAVSSMSADKWVVAYAKMHRAIVCTNDREIKQEIKKLKLKTLVLKGRRRIGWGW